ncbi:MAG: SPFH/Band 7/PHB domain protein, partial [Muribaculaceae bacterium]|nr:SPFH/Band 7/PHB domain protein [Muribaculaceae bacterium]
MEYSSLIFAAILVILAIVVISAGVCVVPQSETRVIERLGRFHSVLTPGLNFIIPFIDKAKTIYTRRIETGVGGRVYVRMTASPVIDLREQVYDFPSQQVITRDNVTT